MDATRRRKLAAIMFTDIAGYSASMQADETLALELLETHNGLLRLLFPRYGGREIKSAGDGFMVEFASTLEAVRCAIEIQQTLSHYNSTVPKDRQLRVRIGLHVGDVVEQGDDVFGDGVNIASRLEPIAEPGGICVSEDVARQIVNKIELPIQRLGKRELKNIQLPVEIYRIVFDPDGQRAAFREPRGGGRGAGALRGAGVLTVALGGVVLLGLGLILHRTAGARNGAGAPPGAFPEGARREARRFYDEGISVLNRKTPAENDRAIKAFQKAIALDPDFAEAHAELAQAYSIRFSYLRQGEDQSEEQANYEVKRALDLNPDCAEAHLVRGILDWTPISHFQVKQALAELRQALALDPRLEGAYFNRGVIYLHLGLFPGALRDLQRATEIQPFSTRAWTVIAMLHVYDGEYETALNELSRTAASFSPSMWSAHEALALLCLGRRREAAATLTAYLARYPNDPGGVVSSTEAILDAAAGRDRRARAEINTAIADGWGFLHFHHAEYNIACAYALTNDHSHAIEWLKNCAEDGFPCYPMFAKSPLLRNLRADARFQAFLEQQRRQWELLRKGTGASQAE